MSHLISLSTKVDKLHHFITLSKEYQEDLRMWSTFLSGWNLFFFFYDDQITVAGDMELFTVAASNFGFGDYFQRKWFSSDWHLALAFDNIFVSFGGSFSRSSAYQWVRIVPLFQPIYFYTHELEFLQKLVKDKMIHEARAFNFTYRYIDDVLSINNSRFAEFLPLIYPPKLEIKETTDTASSASFLDIYLEVDNSGQLSTKIYMINVITSILK